MNLSRLKAACFSRTVRRSTTLVVLAVSTACDNAIDPPPANSVFLQVLGKGAVNERYTGEVWVRGNVAYTTTWGYRSAYGDAVKIWDLSGGADPVLVDSLIVPNAFTLGDVQTSDDGTLLIVATEGQPGSIVIYGLADPLHPQLINHYVSNATAPGVHTAEVQRVNGRLYAFLAIDPPAPGLVIVDITNPTAPVEVFNERMGQPFMHDVFVRDGILFTALWDGGVSIWDIGGAGSGSVSAPRLISNVKTVGGQVHNIWWYHSSSGEKRYAFVGEEGPGAVGSFASGDVHVVDVSNLAAPQEVAFYRLEGAGTHNFSVDESRGLLYAAFYNGGVRVLDISGDLSSCAPAHQTPDGRCNLGLMGREVANGLAAQAPVFVWGVHFSAGKVYASDMLNGLWALREFNLPD